MEPWADPGEPSPEEAKARAEVAKKTSGEAVAKVDKARKSTIIED